MNIKEVIAVINKMEADGVIEKYAIGGAVGAAFYGEPVATLDVDIFVVFRNEPGSLLITLNPIFTYLNARGYQTDGEYILIEGWPVQFLPASGPLVDDALAKSVSVNVDDVRAKVFTAEHLAAIALQVGRAKDNARLLQFIEAGVLNSDRFQEILSTYELTTAWRRFEQRFLGDHE